VIFRPAARAAGRRENNQHHHCDYYHQRQQRCLEDEDWEPFPLSCHPLDTTVLGNLNRQCQHLDHLPTHSLASETSPSKDHPRGEGNQDSGQHDDSATLLFLLRRIQIVHVANVRDMCTTLLRMQGWDVASQPLGGILVDDFDRIVSTGQDENNQPGASVRWTGLAASRSPVASSPSRVTQLGKFLHSGTGRFPAAIPQSRC
jgi:hypothetical protein